MFVTKALGEKEPGDGVRGNRTDVHPCPPPRAGLAAARARGRLGGRPRKVTREVLTMAMSALADREANPTSVARSLGITTTTLYEYLNGDGTPKEIGQRLLNGECTESAAPYYVAEGFATAAAIHEVTGRQAAVAFNAGNLKSVAQELRRQWPDRPLVLCADDDVETSGNPGLSAAQAAAQAVPDFGTDRPEGVTDFNDLAIAQGPEAVRNSLQDTKSAFPALEDLVAMSRHNPGHPFRPDVVEQLGVLRTAGPRPVRDPAGHSQGTDGMPCDACWAGSSVMALGTRRTAAARRIRRGCPTGWSPSLTRRLVAERMSSYPPKTTRRSLI